MILLVRVVVALGLCGASAAPRAAVAAVASAAGRADSRSLAESVIVAPGRALWLRDADIAGTDAPRAAHLRRALRTRGGATVDWSVVQADIARVLREEADAGHPFATVHPEIVASGDTAQLVLRLDRGALVRFGPTALTGARITRPSTVARLLHLTPGTPYDASAVRRAEERLAGSRLFLAGQVSAPLDSAIDGVVPVRVALSEPPYTRAEGAVGYLGKGQGLAGRLALSMGNIAGSGASGAARWERGAAGLADYTLEASQPWVRRWPLGISGRLRSVAQDTVYSRLEWTLRLEPALGTTWRLSLGLAGSRGVAAPALVTRSTATQVVAGLRHVGAASAPRALTLDGEIAWGGRTDRVGPVATHAGAGSAALVVEARHSLGLGWEGVLRGGSHDLLGASVQGYDALFVGGARSLRGYRERQFTGTHVAQATAELRYLLDDAGSRVDAFCDLGWIRQSAHPEVGTQRPLGIGAGVWTAGPGGVVGIEYGVPVGAPRGPGQLHLSLETRF